MGTYTFGLCHDPETLNAVAALRRLANVAGGRADAEAPLSAWRDAWDERADIAVARTAAGEVGATVRVAAPAEGDRWLCAPYAETLTSSEQIQAAEVSRVAVHPDHQGSRLAVTMAAFMCVLTWRQGRTRCIGSSSADVRGFWAHLGISVAPVEWPAAWPMRARPLCGLALDIGPHPPTVAAASPAFQRAICAAWEMELTPRTLVR